jgi:hypothetical protein
LSLLAPLIGRDVARGEREGKLDRFLESSGTRDEMRK